MNNIASAYDAKDYESDIYLRWESSGAFLPSDDVSKKPYAIMMPPPNATGTLHLGHATMLAIEDTIIRFKRMQGYSTLYLPGTDHAAIATQSVVEKKLQKEGIANPREHFGREGLIDKIRAFAEESKDTIRNQIRKMGTSCDWSREKYTFSDDMNFAVNSLFKMMYEDELIYRGDRIVNWDPKMQTTVADDELEYAEEKTKFYTFKYGPFEIATARPETKFGDKYVVMHPDDARYASYKHGDTFEAEWINGKVIATVIKDSAVDPEFGTGVMTITPWHDATDFEIAERHNLDKEQIIDFNGNLLEVAGEFAGMKIALARDLIAEKLNSKGLLVKVQEDYVHNVAVNYRGKAQVEPQIMKQWFVDVNKKAVQWHGKNLSLKEVMQEVVNAGEINIIPARFEKTYFHWINNLRDWCISRQIWWGHRIPVWYNEGKVQCSFESPGEGWTQDEDTLDTWFSSGLWTFSTLGWPNKTDDLMKFAPSGVLETGYDILFFWVARMILMTTYAMRKSGFSEENSLPFKDVYLHGLIRDINGKKMSKSNPETCIDPLDMIEKYGTDSVRLSLMIGSSPGSDMRLYEEKIAGYRNFVNKVWNGARFVIMNLENSKDYCKFVDENNIDFEKLNSADKWILTRLNTVSKNVGENIEKYNFSEAGLEIYDFFWGEFCDWYLEISKIRQNKELISHVLLKSLKLMHPFMPFVTEALWAEFGMTGMLIDAEWPLHNPNLEFEQESADMKTVMELVKSIRSLRAESKIAASKKITVLCVAKDSKNLIAENSDIICRLANLEKLDFVNSVQEKSLSAFIADIEIYIPIAGTIDIASEKIRLLKEIEQVKNYMQIIESKLKNSSFVQNAPDSVVQKEHEKLDEALQKLRKLETQIMELE